VIEERPAWLPVKFASAERLANAYRALEREWHASRQECSELRDENAALRARLDEYRLRDEQAALLAAIAQTSTEGLIYE
jgi:cell division protein FtsB